MMVVGVDSHKDILVCAVVDDAGRAAGSESFPNTAAGHKAMLAWTRELGSGVRVGIEGSGSYGRGLAQLLISDGTAVADVPPQMTARARRRQRTRTKPTTPTRWASPGSQPANKTSPRSNPPA